MSFRVLNFKSLKMTNGTVLDLQNAICLMEFQYKELQAEYDLCKTNFERLTQLEMDTVEIREEVQNVLTKFWTHIEEKTRIYNNILSLKENKAQLIKRIKDLWESQKITSSSSNSISVEIPCVQGYKEYTEMKFEMISLSLNWMQHNLTKYKFALEHVDELNEQIKEIVQIRKRKNIFNIKPFKIKKLNNDRQRYSKMEKSLKEEIEKLDHVLNALEDKLGSGKQKWLHRIQKASRGVKVYPIGYQIDK